MEDEFPANSNKQKAKQSPREPNTEKIVTRVVETEVVRRKKPLGRRIKELFMGGDARGVGAYVFMEILLPGARDMVVDAGQEAISRAVYGEGRPPGRRGSGTNRSIVNYNGISKGSSPVRREDPRPSLSRRARATHDFDEIILQTRVDADEVIVQLLEMISRYNVATVADLYGLVGETPHFTDEKWGWDDLRTATVRRLRPNAYLLDLPKPEPID